MATVYITKHTVARTVNGERVNHPPKTEVPSKGVPAFTKEEIARLKKFDAIEAKVAAAESDDTDDDNANDGDDAKAALVARARELGVKGVSKSWGDEKLQEAITKAEAAAKDGDDGL